MVSGAQPVVVERRGPVEVVTLNRPGRRNAIDLELRVALAKAIEAAMTAAGVRAVVLTGAGGTFCSGGDISTMARMPAAAARPRLEAAARVVRAIWDGDKPVVAAVEGAAFGAGAALALACDRVVAAADTRWGLSFTRVGLAGDMGITASLPARVGPAAARQLLMLPQVLDGDAAAAAGLVDVVVAPGAVLDRAVADARQLAEAPPLALAAIKRMIGAWPIEPRAALEAEIDEQARLFDTDDFAEGVAAFDQRRSPDFAGS